MSKLSSDFLIELAKACVVNKEILDVVKQHLNYSYIAGEPYKIVFKYLFDYHDAHNTSPSIGILTQSITDPKCLEIIGRIRRADVYDNKEELVKTLQDFIKRGRFVKLHEDAAKMYSDGKHDEAMHLLAEESKLINEFSLGAKLHSRIFADFDKRQKLRQEQDHTVSKVATGTPQLDYHTRGGVDLGTGILGIAKSGGGKTTFLRSLGANCAFRGGNVIHFAAGDSTQVEVENGYDAWWTGVDLHEIKEGKLTGSDVSKINKAREAWLSQCGEIYVHVFNQFHSATIGDCRGILMELLKSVDIKLVLFDYLELFEPGDGKRYGTNQEGVSSRKKATAEKIINIATEFNVAVGTVTQASDIPKELWNDPNFVITRNNISNLKATIDPFAYCITLNQTEDENDNNVMRIHEEKLRHYPIHSFSSTYHVAQRRDIGKFIDYAGTVNRFWDPVDKKIIRYTPVKKAVVKKEKS